MDLEDCGRLGGVDEAADGRLVGLVGVDEELARVASPERPCNSAE